MKSSIGQVTLGLQLDPPVHQGAAVSSALSTGHCTSSDLMAELQHPVRLPSEFLKPTGQHGGAAADWMAAGEGGASAGSMRPAGGAGRESGREGGAGVQEQSPAGAGEAGSQRSEVT